MILAVVAADSTAAQGLRQTLDLVPAELESGCHHQHPVAERGACNGAEPVIHRIKAGHRVPNPVHACGNQVALGAAGLLEAEHPSPHQGPAGLVVVIAARFQDRHIERWPGPLELGGNGYASSPAANNQNLVVDHKKGCRFSLGWVPFT